MIQNKTARRMLYDWHGGQSSAFYAAASSGLCASFTTLALEVDTMDDPKDRTALLSWIQHRQTRAPQVHIRGVWYYVLPWVSRTHYPEVKP